MIITVTANPAVDRVYRIDKFSMGEVHRPDKITVSAGGKGINVARVAKTLDAQVLALGFIGGHTGEYIEKCVKELGIECDFTKIKGITRTNVNITDRNGKSGEILETGPEILCREKEAFFNSFKKAIEKECIVVVSGSLPKGLDSSFYCEMIQLCHKKSRKIIVDTSGSTLVDIMKQKPFMVKPNKDELCFIFGKNIQSDDDIKSCLLEMKDMGVDVPFATMGKDGAMALIDSRFIKYSIPNTFIVLECYFYS